MVVAANPANEGRRSVGCDFVSEIHFHLSIRTGLWLCFRYSLRLLRRAACAKPVRHRREPERRQPILHVPMFHESSRRTLECSGRRLKDRRRRLDHEATLREEVVAIEWLEKPLERTTAHHMLQQLISLFEALVRVVGVPICQPSRRMPLT